MNYDKCFDFESIELGNLKLWWKKKKKCETDEKMKNKIGYGCYKEWEWNEIKSQKHSCKSHQMKVVNVDLVPNMLIKD